MWGSIPRLGFIDSVNFCARARRLIYRGMNKYQCCEVSNALQFERRSSHDEKMESYEDRSSTLARSSFG
jgi:hypothetical protein